MSMNSFGNVRQVTNLIHLGRLLKSVVLVDSLDEFDAKTPEGGSKSVKLPTDRLELERFIERWEAKYATKAKLGLSSLLVIPLVACGGGGGGFGGIGGVFGGGGGGGGRVVDGPLIGATVFRDMNDNGIQDAGEYSVTTDANGNFTGLGGSGGKIVASGGQQMTANGLQPFTGKLIAPDGSGVVTPLTTLVSDLISKGLTEADAQTKVLANLGLAAGTNLTSIDPTTNAALMAAGMQVISLLNAAEASGVSFDAAITGLGTALNSGSVDLTSAAGIASALHSTGVTTVSDALAASLASANEAIFTALVTNGHAWDDTATLDAFQSAVYDQTALDTLTAELAGIGNGNIHDGTNVAAHLADYAALNITSFYITSNPISLAIADATGYNFSGSVTVTGSAADISAAFGHFHATDSM